MNLSKTAKRFLSSTMAIALAGGSVLAFGNSASAAPPADSETADEVVSFKATVDPQCALVTATDVTNYTETPYASINALETGTSTPEDRVNILSATDIIKFDCNTDTVNLTISGITNSGPTASNATDIQGSHVFTYTPTGGTAVDVTAVTNKATDTDVNGDLELTINSNWTSTGPELLKGNYEATATFQVTAP
jgi:hypothetical protein